MKLEKVKVSLESLLLDPNNPRFADISDDALNIDKSRFGDAAIQSAAYEKMTNPKFDTLTLANSISTVGFVPVDNIVVAKLDDARFYVIEGNRRTTAIKYLLKQHSLGLSTLSEEAISNLSSIDVLVVDDVENSTEFVGMIIQGIRNVSGIKEWDGKIRRGTTIHAEFHFFLRQFFKAQNLVRLVEIAGKAVAHAHILHA